MLFLAGFALVLLQGRQTAESNLGGGAVRWVGLTWRPITLAGGPLADGGELEVRFLADGRIEGFAGCNNFFGSLERAQDGVSIRSLATSRKACSPSVMAVEDAFIAALSGTASIEHADTRLSLRDKDGALLAELQSGGVVAAP